MLRKRLRSLRLVEERRRLGSVVEGGMRTSTKRGVGESSKTRSSKSCSGSAATSRSGTKRRGVKSTGGSAKTKVGKAEAVLLRALLNQLQLLQRLVLRRRPKPVAWSNLQGPQEKPHSLVE
jgi:hypothetical protein